MNKLVCLIIASLGLFSGCRTHHAATTIPFSELQGEWNVIELNGASLNPKETHQFLSFDTESKRLSGNAGCNRIMGSLAYDAQQSDAIRFPQIATTRMACPDMKGEQELLQTLDKVARFGSEKTNTVALYDQQGQKLLVLKRK